MMTIGSLFAGYGGLDLAVEAAFGARTEWVSEIDPGACKVLAHRFPDAPNLGDITTIDWASVEPVDIITGGSPCQDLSTAGRRAGMTDGTRSNLWVQMREAIAHVQPRFVVWENVRGALSAHAASDLEPCAGCVGDGRDKPSLRALGRVLGDLAELGFDAEWRGLRASDVGACHQRFRVFVLAWRRDAADVDDARLRRRDPQGAAPARRYGHAEPGFGGPDLAMLPTIKASNNENRSSDWASGPNLLEALTLLPTPAASVANDGEGTDSWLARRERVKETANNGNGMGMPLTIAVQFLPTPTTDDAGNITRDSGQFQSLTRSVTQLPTQETETIHAEARPSEALPSLRRPDGEEAVREAARGSDALPEQEDLLPAMREQQGHSPSGHPPLESSPDQAEGEVREVRHDRESACPSQGSGCHEQRPVQPDDALRELPSQASLARRPHRANGVDFGPYETAIQRWEAVLGREAPTPTEPGANGRPRLSAEFASWMMGLPAGWITDVPGVTRNEALRACGNGVVPQQAHAALVDMLTTITQERAA